MRSVAKIEGNSYNNRPEVAAIGDLSMRTNRQIERPLKIASEALKAELEGVPGLRLKRNYRSWGTDTLGRNVILATWGIGAPRIELWLDQAAGQDVYRFWYGFYSETSEKIKNLISQLPAELAPLGRPYTEKDWELLRVSTTSGYVFKAPNESKLTRPFWECYDKQKWGGFFGRYDWGGHASQTSMQLDAWGAGAFIRNIVKAISGNDDLGASEDEELEGFTEGTQRKVFILHRKREAKLRKQKIREALRVNGALACEVPNCGFNFAKRYGKLGNEYAQVHHKKPLSSAPRQGRTITLNDLAIVCANCHAMIHRYGKCRPLHALIRKSARKAADGLHPVAQTLSWVF
jgi:hypothetical protein